MTTAENDPSYTTVLLCGHSQSLTGAQMSEWWAGRLSCPSCAREAAVEALNQFDGRAAEANRLKSAKRSRRLDQAALIERRDRFIADGGTEL